MSLTINDGEARKHRAYIERIVDRELSTVLEVVKREKMVTVAEDSFYKLLVCETVNNDRSAGGMEDDIPKIIIGAFQMYLYTPGRDYLIKKFRNVEKNKIPNNIKTIVDFYDRHGPEVRIFFEYKEFSNDPTIGNYVFTDLDKGVQCILAHEMAHCLQFWNREEGFMDSGATTQGHNDIWKKYYRILRNNLNLTS